MLTAWPSPAALARSCFPTPGTLFSLPWTSSGLCSSLPPAGPQSPGLGPPLHTRPAQPTQGSSLPSPGPASWSPALGGASGAPHSAVHRAPHTQHDPQSPGVHLAHLSHQPPPIKSLLPSRPVHLAPGWDLSCAWKPPAYTWRLCPHQPADAGGDPSPVSSTGASPEAGTRPCPAPLSS